MASDTAAAAPAAPPTPTVFRPGSPSTHAPLDFCAHKPKLPNGRYQHQRVLLLNAFVGEGAEAPEDEVTDAGASVMGASYPMLQTIHASDLARLEIMSTLPLPRFFTAISPPPAPASIFDKESISLDELRDAVGGDGFAMYSAVCADWLAVPRLERTRATWKKTTHEKVVIENLALKTVKYLAWELSTGWNLSLVVFRRHGEKFELATTLGGTNVGLEGAAAGLAARGTTGDLRDYVSTWPVEGCAFNPQDGQEGGVAHCAGLEPRLTPGRPEATLSSAPFCQNVDDAVDRGPDAMRRVAECEVTHAVESATLLLQRNVKRFDPWVLADRLAALKVPNAGLNRGIGMGAKDGVQRGDYYVAKSKRADGAEQELGFARVMNVGPGGDLGDIDPTVVKFKAGDAPVGTNVYEYALLGVQFGLRPGVLLLAGKGDLATTAAPGGEVNVGCDASKLIPLFDEFWLRGNVGYFGGSSSEGFVAIDVGVEGTTYLGGGLAWIAGAGLSVMTAGKTVRDVGYGGGNAGIFLRGSLEYAFGPDWDLSLSIEGRTGFSNVILSNDRSIFTIDAGPLAGGLALLDLGHTF